MRLVSKRFDINEEYSNIKDLLTIEGKIKKIYLASAYVDFKVVLDLLKHLSKQGFKNRLEVILYIDGNANISQDELTQKKLATLMNFMNRSNFINYSGIRLVNGQLFHSKLIYLESTKEQLLVMGSMNLTNNGTLKNKNEEIIAKTKISVASGTSPFIGIINDALDYFSSLANDNNTVNYEGKKIQRQSVTSLRELFFNGQLIMPMSKISLFRFPLNLPVEFSEKVSAQIHEYLDSEMKTSIQLAKLLQYFEDDKSVERIEFKKYCLETIYGYWAPRHLVSKITEQTTRSTKDEEIKEIYTQLISPTFTTKMFHFFDEIQVKINGILKDVNKKPLATWSSRCKERWPKWLAQLKEKLFDDLDYDYDSELKIKKSILVRLKSGLYISNVPDLFENDTVTEDFMESVYNSIDYELSKNRGRNELAKQFIDFDTSSRNHAEFIKHFNKYLLAQP